MRRQEAHRARIRDNWRVCVTAVVLVGRALTGCGTKADRSTPAERTAPTSPKDRSAPSTAELQRLADPSLAEPILSSEGRAL
jgi:hypothetical protein